MDNSLALSKMYTNTMLQQEKDEDEKEDKDEDKDEEEKEKEDIYSPLNITLLTSLFEIFILRHRHYKLLYHHLNSPLIHIQKISLECAVHINQPALHSYLL